MSAKHTPGPWTLDPTDADMQLIWADGYGGIAQVYCGHFPAGKAGTFNARLIAAAPEMADLLRRILNDGIGGNDVREARALLARIDGED